MKGGGDADRAAPAAVGQGGLPVVVVAAREHVAVLEVHLEDGDVLACSGDKHGELFRNGCGITPTATTTTGRQWAV